MQPGNAGGSNWGGISFDPQRQVAIANTLNLPFVVALIPREQLQAQRDAEEYRDFDFSSQRGTPRPLTASTEAVTNVFCVARVARVITSPTLTW